MWLNYWQFFDIRIIPSLFGSHVALIQMRICVRVDAISCWRWEREKNFHAQNSHFQIAQWVMEKFRVFFFFFFSQITRIIEQISGCHEGWYLMLIENSSRFCVATWGGRKSFSQKFDTAVKGEKLAWISRKEKWDFVARIFHDQKKRKDLRMRRMIFDVFPLWCAWRAILMRGSKDLWKVIWKWRLIEMRWVWDQLWKLYRHLDILYTVLNRK